MNVNFGLSGSAGHKRKPEELWLEHAIDVGRDCEKSNFFAVQCNGNVA